MKIKIKILFILLLSIIVLPMESVAKTIELPEMDFTIELGEEWVVLTRENIKKYDLESIGLTYEGMNEFFIKNDAHLDAIKWTDDGTIELIIIKKELDSKFKYYNLKDAENKYLEKVAKEKQKELRAEDYYIFESNNNKYLNIDYSQNGMYINDFYTVVNGNVYTIKFQSPKEISALEQVHIFKVIHAMQFEFEDPPQSIESEDDFDFTKLIEKMVIGGIAGGIISVFGLLFSKKNKR